MTDFSIDIRKKAYPATSSTGAHIAIKDLQIHLQQNEFVCLVGPSGCGKTTLMNILAGIDKDFDGEINLGEQPTLNNKVGYVFQEPRLLPWCTVIQNINLVLDGREDSNLVDELLEIMEIADLKHHYPGQISLGMARRVALVRAFVIQPQILLMDEPFVSLDANNARKIRQRLLDVWHTKPHTILFVTHDIREAIYLANRIVFLNQAPTRVLDQISISLSQQDRVNEEVVERFRQSIIQNHPEIATYC